LRRVKWLTWTLKVCLLRKPPIFYKEVSRIVDKRVATEIGQYRSYAQKFAESVGLEVKSTWDKMK
jgi:hypothetical protein